MGQNVNSYGRTSDDDRDFTDLICALGEIPGIERIRFTTSHPKDLSQRLIDCFGKVAPLCEHIHLPVQSGSDRVLKRMNRGYTAEDVPGEGRRAQEGLSGNQHHFGRDPGISRGRGRGLSGDVGSACAKSGLTISSPSSIQRGKERPPPGWISQVSRQREAGKADDSSGPPGGAHPGKKQGLCGTVRRRCLSKDRAKRSPGK